MIRKLYRASDPELDAQLDLILKHHHDEQYSPVSHLHDNRYPLKATTLAGYGITDAYTKEQVDSLIFNNVRPGTIAFVPRITPWPGWIKANGTLLSRIEFANLWEEAQDSGLLVDETTWNSGYYGCYSTGDGSTTFRIPMIDGRTIVGAGQGTGLTNRPAGSTGGTETHTLTTTQLPVIEGHTHQETFIANDNTIRDAWTRMDLFGGSYLWGPTGANSGNGDIHIPVHTKPAGGFGGGQPHNNMQPYVALPAYIKY